MAFDGSVLRGILGELEESFLGKRIRSVKLDKRGVFLEFSGGVGISIALSRSFSSIFASDSPVGITDQPDPPFVLLLRKHLVGSELIRVYQHEFDRVAFLQFETRYASRLVERRKLALELFPGRANAILLEDERIVVSAWKEKGMKSRYYLPPISRRVNPLLFRNIGELSIDRISAVFQGTSENLLDYLSSGSVSEKWESWINALEKRAFLPVLFIAEEGFPLDYWILDYDFPRAAAKESFATLSELVRSFMIRRMEFEEEVEWRKRREKERRDRLKYLLKKRDKLLDVIEREEEARRLKLLGEIILANISFIKKGEREASLLNPYTGELETIRLDPSLSPAMNAQKLFKEASKLKRGVKKAREELARVEMEIAKLDAIDGIEKVTKEKREKKEQKSSLPFREFDYKGWKILVGKGAKSNELLTFKKASPEDIWLHVRGSPGSHVVVRNPWGSELPGDVLEFAASLAAYYSKARMNAKVPVDYTLVKYVKRHPSGKRGAVLVRNQNTIWVRPRSGEIS
ncbi:MAG: NFACT family protein [Synergistetes bacterium]|nr:NFACT family protein [Synergistota bacterium]